jgi:hypothetical protein
MLQLIVYQEVDLVGIDGPPPASDVCAVLENQRVGLRGEQQGEKQDWGAACHWRPLSELMNAGCVSLLVNSGPPASRSNCQTMSGRILLISTPLTMFRRMSLKSSLLPVP